MSIKLLVCFTPLLLLAAPPPSRFSDTQVKAKVDGLLKQMTLEEKIGQISQLAGLPMIPDSMSPEERVRRGNAGSILWLDQPSTINKMQKIAVEESRLHIPLIFGLDVVHGFRTIFPIPLGLAASWDMQLIERVQTAAAREARSAGISWTFAPMLDIARDPRWGRLVEGAGEDPYLGSAVARAQVRGFQGDDISSPDRLLACAKHFAGYGAADGGRDYDSSYLSDEQLWNVYLPPFKAAADAGVGTFMAAYMDLNGVPATGNRFLLQDVLRKTWKYEGMVVSDAFSVRDLATHGFARSPEDAASRAFSAGVDMDMASRTYLENMAAVIKSGKVSMHTLDDAVRRILEAKVRLGLFEQPYVDDARHKQILASPDTRTLARTAAQHAAVLLRNEGGLLPLDKRSGKTVAVIGPVGDSQRDVLSMWSGFSVDVKAAVTVAQGIRNKLDSPARVQFAPGVQIAKQYPSMFEGLMGGVKIEPWTSQRADEEFAKAVEVARGADVVVLTLGELAFMSGELASQSTIELPGRQQQLMEAVVALGKPTVLVLVAGRPLNITWASGHVPAILHTWLGGHEAGNAIADLLYGDATPGGKLPITWPRDGGQIPVYYAHTLTHQPEGSPGFTSRYWDQLSSPLYPFGYGLSYTSFAYSNLHVSNSSPKLGSWVEVTVDVANTGSRAGEEVAQLYIHQQAGSASRPVRELKGFQKVALAAGEKKTVKFTLGKDELSYWSQQERHWLQEAEAFDVWAGGDSRAALHGQFTVVP